MMTEKEIMESLELKGHEDLFEQSAKIIEWFLDTSWYESWSVEDSKPFGAYIRNVVAELRNLK